MTFANVCTFVSVKSDVFFNVHCVVIDCEQYDFNVLEVVSAEQHSHVEGDCGDFGVNKVGARK